MDGRRGLARHVIQEPPIGGSERLASDRRAGVGLGSMRERAEELGGTLDLDQRPGGGTCVRAQLPLPSEART